MEKARDMLKSLYIYLKVRDAVLYCMVVGRFQSTKRFPVGLFEGLHFQSTSSSRVRYSRVATKRDEEKDTQRRRRRRRLRHSGSSDGDRGVGATSWHKFPVEKHASGGAT
ncbi:hypothetical protein PV325_013668 [Microctonus aethiopoides]|nr:hypothetical protein PV325_013668 [Microctonus aethiopoides]KAK0085417.1 hypothetical protein PV326_005914 [Microctonus aethiopoides]